MAKAHGRNGEIQIGGSSPLTVIGSLNAWSLSGTRDKVDTTSFGDNNKNYLAGLKDVSGSFEGFFDTSYIRTLLQEADSATGTIVRITPSTDEPTFYYQGPAWLDISQTGSVSDAVKVSGSFSANGDWLFQVDNSPLDE